MPMGGERSGGDGFEPNTKDTHRAAIAHLQSCWSELEFVTWWLNGADLVVVKYKKWEQASEASRLTLVTMGRPGDGH